MINRAIHRMGKLHGKVLFYHFNIKYIDQSISISKYFQEQCNSTWFKTKAEFKRDWACKNQPCEHKNRKFFVFVLS